MAARKGKRKDKADALTPSEEEELWIRKALGGDMPQVSIVL